MGDQPAMKVGTGSAHADLVVVPVLAGGEPGPGAADLDAALGVGLREVCRRHDVTGKQGDVLLVPGAACSVLLVGVGPAAEVNAGVIREAAQRAGRAARPFATVATTLVQLVGTSDAAPAARAIAEGFLLGAYRFDGDKTSPEPNRTRTVTALVTGDAKAAARKGLERGRITAGATNWARDLTNTSASTTTPEALAEAARSMAKDRGLTCKVWSGAALERGGFGGILAVGRGSANEPRMVELAYRGGGRAKPIALTGKGITFDSGGLNIKKRQEMSWMRADMAGAVAAMATVRAVAELSVKANVIAAIPFAENIPGPSSYRPGDVVRHRGGKTSEVLDTDSEGRVLLADALAYLCEQAPSVILDSATLTDAAGLGLDLFAVMGDDAASVRGVIEAGEAAGDRGWEIPLWSRYHHLIDSEVADVKNVGSYDVDNSMMAGLFLRTFVDPAVPWVHLDIGSSAWAEYPSDLWPEGATGSPTRVFIRFIEQRAGSAPD